MNAIKTIGHSNHSLERFIELLKAGGVETVVDVRSTPYSRRFPQFSREQLTKSLAAAGILYRHEGAALGGKRSDGASYDALAERQDFKDVIGRLIAASAETTLCLMCAEKQPTDCHRTVLVSRRLAERGAAVEHLLADGRSESHASVEDRLLKAAGEDEADLFSRDEGRSERLARAYRSRERAMSRR